MATTALFFFPSSHFSPLHRNPNPNFSKSFSSYLSISSSFSSNNINGISPLLAVPAPRAAVAEIAATSQELLEISKLGISDQIVSALSRRGITELFPIQRAVLEPAMEGRDMIGRAITGSGKTLAFGIPILDKIIRDNQHSKKRIPSALVLAPTRELARQVQQEFKASAPTLSSTCLYGGISISNQIRTLGFGMDIVVGTPGRIIDLVERGALDLSEVKFVVLDEADQMLAIGFQEAVECILSYLPAKKQCMLFSATMPSWVNQLSRKYLRNPLVVDLVGDCEQKLADGITLYSVASNNTNKPSLLPTLISTYAQGGKSIIFTKTKRDAESLSRSMSSMIGSKALHGDMQQLHRDRTLAAFREGRFDVLVATDVAARGLDIPNVDLVIHFEMPNSSEFFVHRSGRTGRAGNKGTAILMFNESQRRTVRSMERELGFNFEELRGITGTKIEASRSLYESDDDTASHRPQYGKYGRSQQNTTSRYSQGGNYATSQAYNTPRYSQGGTNYGTSQGYSPSKYGNSWGSNTSKYSEGGKFGKSWGSNNSTSRTSERGSYGRPQGSNGNNTSRFSDSSRNKSYSSRTSESRYGGGRDNGGSRNQWSKQRDYDDGDDRTSTRGFSSGSDAPERSYGSRRTQDKGSDFDFDQLLDLFKD